MRQFPAKFPPATPSGGHPKLGASWQGLIIELITTHLELDETYFWATHGGAELDLLAFKGSKTLGVEIKRSTIPTITRSMRQAVSDLRLDRLWIIHAGPDTYELEEGVTAISANRLNTDL